jgi:hypothetical protein
VAHHTAQLASVRARRRAARPRPLGEPFSFRGRSVVAVHAGFYRNGQSRIDVVDERSGAIVATPTAPADRYTPCPRNVVLLSDASSNRGIVAELEKAGVVSDTGVMIDDRNGRLHVCELFATVSR